MQRGREELRDPAEYLKGRRRQDGTCRQLKEKKEVRWPVVLGAGGVQACPTRAGINDAGAPTTSSFVAASNPDHRR